MTTTDLVRALDDALLPGAFGMDSGVVATDPLDIAGAAEAAEVAALLDTADLVLGLGPAPGPHPEFRRALAATLTSAPRPSSLAASRPWWGRAWRRTVYAGAVTSAVAAFVAVGAVRASASALPDELLYPVKRTVEWARMAMAGDGDVALHLELASLRLSEAVAVPGAAARLLAEFSREVTAGLASADAAMARGVPRDELAPPLLGWLLSARTELVSERAIMPPLAWRAALALVDEAILALRTDGPLTLRPVPRLEDALVALRQWSPPAFWLRPVGGWLSALRGNGSGGAGSGADQTGVSGGGLGPIVVVVPRPTDASVIAATAAASAPFEPPQDEPTEPNVPPIATAPTVPDPTDVPATPTRVDPLPTPTQTVVPANRPPVVTVAWCSPNPVVMLGHSQCAVQVDDESAGTLRYAWTADAGQMINDTAFNPIYYASFQHDVKETTTWINVVVTDEDGATGDYRFLMKVDALPQGGHAAPARTSPGP